MSHEPNAETLLELTSRVFQEAAFLFIEPAMDELPISEDVWVAEISFSGPRNGSLLVAMSPAGATIAAANLLGAPPEAEEAQEQSESALAELLNMLAGTMMVEWFGKNQITQLGLPTLTHESQEDFKAHLAAQTVQIYGALEEDIRVDIGLQILD